MIAKFLEVDIWHICEMVSIWSEYKYFLSSKYYANNVNHSIVPFIVFRFQMREVNPSLVGATVPTAKLSPEAYLRRHHVLTYLEDALSQMALQEHTPRSQSESAKFLADYFASVLTENHVMFRGVSFIMATPHNRLSFLKGVRKSYQYLLQSTEQLSLQVFRLIKNWFDILL